jgi:hypothetical protein
MMSDYAFTKLLYNQSLQKQSTTSTTVSKFNIILSNYPHSRYHITLTHHKTACKLIHYYVKQVINSLSNSRV